jgi:hypothetical protein
LRVAWFGYNRVGLNPVVKIRGVKSPEAKVSTMLLAVTWPQFTNVRSKSRSSPGLILGELAPYESTAMTGRMKLVGAGVAVGAVTVKILEQMAMSAASITLIV